ncbi:MAG: DUF2058 family protein [Planctomycetota bacterium]
MNLRDQLEKAKLLSKKDAKRLAHEERVHRKEVGREGIEAEKSARESELVAAREQQRLTDAERQKVIEAERKRAEELAACEAILDTEVRAPSRGAPWYFELSDGRVPHLRVDDSDRHKLVLGNVCVVRRTTADSHSYGLLPTPLAQRVAKMLPERVVWSAPPANLNSARV